MPGEIDGRSVLSLPDLVELNRLFRDHAPRLRRMLEGRIDPRLAARVSADDVLQDTFVLAQARWDGFKATRPPPLGWLYRLALDRLIETARRETRTCRDARKDVVLPERSTVQLANQLVGSLTSASRAVEREEVRARVREAVARLTEKDQQILSMTFIDNLPAAEVAAALDLSRAAVYKRLARALLRLRAILADLAPE